MMRAPQALERVIGDITPLAGATDTENNLVAAEWFRDAVALDDQQDGLLNRRETAFTGRAFTTPTDRRPRVDDARVDDARVIVMAERAVHGVPSPPFLGPMTKL